jgi:type 1 glutamine amidotransferase
MKTNHIALCQFVAATLAQPAFPESFVKNEQDRARIEQAIPAEAPARPAKARRLLIFTLNVGYGGHPSMAYANEAFTLMGKRTGTFETVVTNDPAVFQRESLKRFDAVFFNNTVGNCFTNSDLRQNLVEFITGGGGLMGVHGTTVAFTYWPGAIEDWPEFGYLIGGRGANHKDSDEHVWLKLDDPGNPVLSAFGGKPFDYRDEFFRVHEPYSRERVRVLLSIDTDKTGVKSGQPRGNCYREDNDYALAWIRNYGRGRVFYCTIAHNPYVFWDRRMLEFYLAAIQFALGDLPAPTTPSARLTPAVRAQEELGWRLGVSANTSGALPLEQTIQRAAELGLPYIGATVGQKISASDAKEFGPGLSDPELSAVRLKLEASGLRLLTCYLQEMPGAEAGCRQLFEFGRKMGIETFVGEPDPKALPLLDRFCQEYGINLALLNRAKKESPNYWSPDKVLKACRGLSPRVGAYGDLAAWGESRVNPVKAARALKDRLLAVHLPPDQDAAGSNARQAAEFLRELARLGVKPTMFSVDSPAQTTFFNTTTLSLGPTGNSRP